jgi:hypothetical protein
VVCDVPEDLLDRPRNDAPLFDARVLVVALHGVRLASARLTVTVVVVVMQSRERERLR